MSRIGYTDQNYVNPVYGQFGMADGCMPAANPYWNGGAEERRQQEYNVGKTVGTAASVLAAAGIGMYLYKKFFE